MACKICEHCNYPISFDDAISIHEGYSYHDECHKCFVCSETNLHKAEVLMGTILCYGCSQRIFQGCAAVKRRKGEEDRKRRRSYRVMETPENYKDKILRMTQMLWQTEKTSKSESIRRKSRPIKYHMEKYKTKTSNSIFPNDKRVVKCRSNEISTATDVTRYLLECMESSFAKMLEATKQASQQHAEKQHGAENNKLKSESRSSKLRCAELGASTEIANMALRKKSEVAVIIKSQSQTKQTGPANSSKNNSGEKTSTLKQTSGTSANNYVESELSNIKECIFDMQLGTCLLLPFTSFKRHILDRSSVVNCIILKNYKRRPVSNKTKPIVPRKIVNSQKKGVRRLYSTINRNRKPYKMGWLDLTSKSFCCIKSGDCTIHPVRCKHYRRSQNYRRLRNKAMRLAGPTKSQLAEMRAKIFSPLTNR